MYYLIYVCIIMFSKNTNDNSLCYRCVEINHIYISIYLNNIIILII